VEERRERDMKSKREGGERINRGRESGQR